jgi:hypothetical protein
MVEHNSKDVFENLIALMFSLQTSMSIHSIQSLTYQQCPIRLEIEHRTPPTLVYKESAVTGVRILRVLALDIGN